MVVMNTSVHKVEIAGLTTGESVGFFALSSSFAASLFASPSSLATGVVHEKLPPGAGVGAAADLSGTTTGPVAAQNIYTFSTEAYMPLLIDNCKQTLLRQQPLVCP